MSKHSLVIVSDIFGKTPELITLTEELNASAIIDPYQNKLMNFANEEAAYQYFVEQVTLDKYLEVLTQQISRYDWPTTLLGFSVGASIAWRLSQNAPTNIKQIICYYGSQIRHFDTLKPSVATHIVLPKSEAHFDVNLLKDTLAIKDNVKVIETQYFHGFMNGRSTNFNELGYREHIEKLNTVIK